MPADHARLASHAFLLFMLDRDFDIEPQPEFYPFTYDIEAFRRAVGSLPVSSDIPAGKGQVRI